MCRSAGFPPALLHLVMSHQLDLPVRQAGMSRDNDTIDRICLVTSPSRWPWARRWI